MKRSKLFLTLIFTLFLASTGAFAEPKKPAKAAKKRYLMAALGDSITAGLLASTQLNWFNTDGTISEEGQNLEDYITKLTVVVDLPGPRPDRATGAYAGLGHTLIHMLETRTTSSWATGKNIASHYVLLKNYLNKNEPGVLLDALNPAVTGGITRDLIPQADAVMAEMKTGKYAALKYVTILIGNNDACSNRPFSEMKNDLQKVFSKLASIKQDEPIRVLMSGIPRIPDLGESSISQSKTVFKMSCDALRVSFTKVCLPLTEWNSQGQYQDRVEFTQSVNEMLMSAAAEANVTFPHLEVRFTNRLFDEGLIRTELAVDCFHPTASSHARISQELWHEQPWFN